jgi:lysophospholipase L1-like esterase
VIWFVGVFLLLAVSLWGVFGRLKWHQSRNLLTLIVGNLLVFLFLASVVAMLGEAYFRYVHDATDSFGLTKTTQDWFDRHFVYNGFGVRDSVEYTNQQPPGTRRITFLGDSFTAGHGIKDVEQRFGNRIRGEFPQCDVHVMAKPGLDTGAEVDALRSMASRGYDLDVVVLVYCLNDISDIAPEWSATLERIHRKPAGEALVENSYLCNWLYFRCVASRDPDVTDYYQFVHDNYRGDVWAEQQQRLDDLRFYVAAYDAQLLVVTFPFLHALGANYSYDGIHEQLDEFWRSQHVPHLDLRATYEGYEPRDLMVNRFDAHPNELAHELAANAIVEFLHDNGIQ